MIEQVVNFFVSNAYAAPTAGTPASANNGNMSLIVLIGVFFLFMYFAVWRPQNRRAKEQQNLLNSLAKGDEVLTTGGMLGRLSKVGNQYLTLTIAGNVDIVVQKSSIVTVLPKGTLKSLE